jgi:hypothetical protein
MDRGRRTGHGEESRCCDGSDDEPFVSPFSRVILRAHFYKVSGRYSGAS